MTSALKRRSVSMFAIGSALIYFQECATPPHVRVRHTMWLSFTRPGYEASTLYRNVHLIDNVYVVTVQIKKNSRISRTIQVLIRMARAQTCSIQQIYKSCKDTWTHFLWKRWEGWGGRRCELAPVNMNCPCHVWCHSNTMGHTCRHSLFWGWYLTALDFTQPNCCKSVVWSIHPGGSSGSREWKVSSSENS